VRELCGARRQPGGRRLTPWATPEAATAACAGLSEARAEPGGSRGGARLLPRACQRGAACAVDTGTSSHRPAGAVRAWAGPSGRHDVRVRNARRASGTGAWAGFLAVGLAAVARIQPLVPAERGARSARRRWPVPGWGWGCAGGDGSGWQRTVSLPGCCRPATCCSRRPSPAAGCGRAGCPGVPVWQDGMAAAAPPPAVRTHGWLGLALCQDGAVPVPPLLPPPLAQLCFGPRGLSLRGVSRRAGSWLRCCAV